MNYRRRQKYVPRMMNMSISSTHTSRQQRAVREKRADVKTASKCNRKNLTNANALKLKKAQNELASIYLKEQTEHIQN